MCVIKIWKERSSWAGCWRFSAFSAGDCRCRVLIISGIQRMYGRRCCLLELFLGNPCTRGEGFLIRRILFLPFEPRLILPILCLFLSLFDRNSSSCFEWIDRLLFRDLKFGAELLKMYWLNFYLGWWYSDDVCCCSLESFRRGHIWTCVCGHVFISWLEVLTLYESVGLDVASGLSEGVRMKIFRLDGVYISSVSWNFSWGFRFSLSLELVIDLGGDVPEWEGSYPVYPGTIYPSRCPSNICSYNKIISLSNHIYSKLINQSKCLSLK